MQDLGTLGGTYSGTSAINERGQVVGLSTINSIPNPGTGIPTIDPFFWDGHKMIDIGSLGGTFGVAVRCEQSRPGNRELEPGRR